MKVSFPKTWARYGKPAATVLTTIALAISGCTKSNDESDPSAFSNRPQSFDRFIAILKLKTPAILSSAVKGGSELKVDESLREKIIAEQDALIEELKSISPDIQILHQYRMVLNGVAIIAPRDLENRFRSMTSVAYVEKQNSFQRLDPVSISNGDIAAESTSLDFINSVSWIGGIKARNDLSLNGEGISVGIIDTGIDYTHKMFGGAGTEEAFRSVDPNIVVPEIFPTAKIVGGIDLVGTSYDSSSPNFEQHIPRPDNNPIDEGGHGTHVAGTVAGIGDGTSTYTGVAPNSKLHAIKVFGADGSTGDAVIIAALEYSADPNGDMSPDDRLDVINMSLGSSYGNPHILYTEAVENLAQGDVIVVASAGNSGGTNTYIVGSPSTSDKALSVAASVDNMEHNWKFSAIAFKDSTGGRVLYETIEATFSKPIADAGDIKGSLVHIGLADRDLTDEQKAALKGNVALISRGGVPFSDKVRRAEEAGAIGAVVYNNVDGQPIVMGGDGSFGIPAVMISNTLGAKILADIAAGGSTIEFQSPEKIEKPELIDTLTSFSSRGPRSVDGFIKPEISAPGSNILSAKIGGGDKGVRMSGTSMAAPHVAGVAALMKQKHPTLTADQLKSLMVTTATSITDTSKQIYPVAHMGAGRVQTFEAASAGVVFTPATLSLGETLVEAGKTVRKELTLTNISSQAVTLSFATKLDEGLSLDIPSSITLAAGEIKKLPITVKIAPVDSRDASLELDGFLTVSGDTVKHQIPVLAVVNKTGRIAADKIVVAATSAADQIDAVSSLNLENKGKTSGDALVFNLLGKDGRKDSRTNPARNGICDLESVGWRVVRQSIEGKDVDMLQFAFKLYNPVTSWHLCEASIQIDGNGDGVADQELLGTYVASLSGNSAQNQMFFSLLTDASQMRKLRSEYEASFPNGASPDYTATLIDVQDLIAYNHSTLIVVNADLAKLAKTPAGDLKIKIAVIADSSTPEGDDFLGAQEKWITLTPNAAGAAYYNLPEVVSLASGETKTVSFTRGGARGDGIVYFPYNRSNLNNFGDDDQSKVLKARYAP